MYNKYNDKNSSVNSNDNNPYDLSVIRTNFHHNKINPFIFKLEKIWLDFSEQDLILHSVIGNDLKLYENTNIKTRNLSSQVAIYFSIVNDLGSFTLKTFLRIPGTQLKYHEHWLYPSKRLFIFLAKVLKVPYEKLTFKLINEKIEKVKNILVEIVPQNKNINNFFKKQEFHWLTSKHYEIGEVSKMDVVIDPEKLKNHNFILKKF